MDLNIETLTASTYKPAVEIAIETGEKKDVEERLLHFDNYFVAMTQGKVIGIIGWYLDDNEWAGEALGDKFPNKSNVYWVSHFAVLKEHRGKGVGTQLMQYLEDIVLTFGAEELWVYSERARGFYEKQGYEFVKKGYIEDCWQDFLMKRFKVPFKEFGFD